MFQKWQPDDVVSTKERPLLSGKIEIPFRIETGFYRSLSTANGMYYLVYDDEAYKEKYESNSYKLVLYDGIHINPLMRNLRVWKNRFDESFLVFSSYTTKTIYLIDSRGFIFEVCSYSGGLVSPYYGVDVDKENGCYLINGVKVYYQTAEERNAFREKTRPVEGVSHNKDFNRFVRANSHNALGYLYLTGGSSKCGAFINYFADRGMRVEGVPNILCDDGTINIRIPLDEENTKRKEIHFLCAKYKNEFSIFNLPYQWVGGGLSFPQKWIQKKYDLGFHIPKGKEALAYAVVNNLREAYRTADDYDLFKKTLSKVVRLFEKGKQQSFRNEFTDLLLLYPEEWECTTAYVLERLDYINSLLIGTEDIRRKEREEYIEFIDELEAKGFTHLKSAKEIDDEFLRSELSATDVLEKGVKYNYLYKLAYRKSKQLYKERMMLFESQTLNDMAINGYKISRWKNESNLFSIVAQEYKDAIYQYHCNWLGLQSLDVFIPSLNIGIEYQGEQHYKPIDYFGGEQAFDDLVRRDIQKQKLCKENGVTLIIWKYDEAVSKALLDKKIQQVVRT